MMITSAYTFMYEQKLILLAATFFVLSDIFVAKDRFIKRSTKNALLITPSIFCRSRDYLLLAFQFSLNLKSGLLERGRLALAPRFCMEYELYALVCPKTP